MSKHETAESESLGCFAIGALTVKSFAVSRGRLESLVGKRFAAGGLRVYFAGIHSLFAFILLTNKIMIMFCIGAEYIEHCSDGWFYFFIIQKRENEENFGWMRSVVNSGAVGKPKLKKYQTWF